MFRPCGIKPRSAFPDVDFGRRRGHLLGNVLQRKIDSTSCKRTNRQIPLICERVIELSGLELLHPYSREPTLQSRLAVSAAGASTTVAMVYLRRTTACKRHSTSPAGEQWALTVLQAYSVHLSRVQNIVSVFIMLLKKQAVIASEKIAGLRSV